MNQLKVNDMKVWRTVIKVTGLVAMASAVVAIALAQDFRQGRSTAERASMATQQPTTAVVRTTWDNAGRAFLRWWDPLFELGNEVDNDTPVVTTATGPFTSPILPLTYPTELASGFVQAVVTDPPYRYAPVVTTNTFANQTAGATATYEWQITGLVPNQEYELYVNVPVGPTNEPNGAAPATRQVFGQRYYVYQINDADPLTPALEILDTSFANGGFAPLGNGGAISTVRYRATVAGVITIQLFNTVPKSSQGGFLDPTASPADEVVYADAVKAVANNPTRGGSYVAAPVVAQLVNNAGGGAGAPPFAQRVVSARNESVIVNGEDYELGVLTSFTHNGALADAGNPDRRNMVWSWPARRPFDLSTAEDDRYATERANWILGGPASNPRATVRRMFDNLNGSVVASGPFVSSNNPALNNFNGPDYLVSPAEVNVPATGGVLFEGIGLPEGDYTIQVYLPTLDTVNDLARAVNYEILVNGVVVDTLILDQSTGNGWVTLPNQPADGWEVNALQDLAVRVLNRTNNGADAGRGVFADAVRFVAKSDLKVTASPAMVSADVRVGAVTASRDVVIVASEDGKIYCMDAHGDTATGVPPQVYWVYPSENPTTDPNNDALEDGVGNIATAPFKHGRIAPLVVDTAAGTMVYVAAENGKVFCLEMTGRGDGTTRRRWTWPDDYNPAAPLTPFGIAPGAPVGSPVFVNAGPNGRIVVPYAGVVVALDALGTPASKSTTLDWTSLLASASITTIPGTANLLAINTVGAPNLVQIDANTGASVAPGPVALVGTYNPNIAPLYLPDAVSGLGQDAIYVISNEGRITCLRAADFATLWFADEVLGGPAATPIFTFLRTYDTSPIPGPFIIDAIPSVVVSTNTGQMMGFYASGAVNISGTRRNWRYQLEGDQQPSGLAVGGWPNVPAPPANRSHIYVGDSEGFFYAFSSEDDNDLVPPYTPGRRPGQQQAQDNDPTQEELNGIVEQDYIVLLSPGSYSALFNSLQAGTLTYAEVTAAATAAAQRRDFEFGETLYLMVYNINDPAQPPVGNYNIEVQLTGGGSGQGRPSLRRQQPVRVVSGAPAVEDAGVVLINLALTPTGAGGLVPGQNALTVSAVAGGVRSTPVPLSTSPQTLGLPDFRIANPLGVRFANSDLATGAGISSAGITIDATQLIVRGNQPAGIDTGVFGGPTPWRLKSGGFGGALVDEPGGYFGTSFAATGDGVPHSSSGITQMQIVDRSLMRLLLGNDKGLQNVRLSPGDLEWQPRTNPLAWANDSTDPTLPKLVDPSADLGVFKPLNLGTNKANWLYRSFEDYPWATPNRSIDYPDVNRNGLVATKSSFGSVENPLFNGVQLVPPTVTSANLNTYRTPAGYDAQLIRVLQPTDMELQMNVPTFQPANLTSYRGRQYVYVDAGTPGYQSSDTNRPFALGLRVGVDERLSTGTPTIDLSSLPAGGGFNGNSVTPGLAEIPWITGLFRPWVSAYNSGNQKMFEPFSVLNDGNVNLLNVRLSKAFDKLQGIANRVERPMELFSTGLHELAWLDAAFALYSDLDPFYSAVNRAGLPTNRNILQKARPGDVASTRMSTNPGFRANPNLRVPSGFLLNTANFVPGDPRMGVAAPIGTPVGSYVRKVFAFEDLLDVSNAPNVPALGPRSIGPGADPNDTEPYTDPGITLKFTIRESRMTTRPTTKAAPNVEALAVGNANYEWSNRQPTMLRTPEGNFMAAFASNRQTVANTPGFNARLRTPADLAGGDQWRIYVATMFGNTFAGAPIGSSPIRELNGWVPDPTLRWFQHTAVIPDPATPLPNLFTLGTGETLDLSQGPASARFHSPSFASNAFVNPLTNPNNSGQRTGEEANGDPYLAFIGEATKQDASGTQSRLNQLFVADLNHPAGSLNNVFAMPWDLTSNKSRPAVVQADDVATIFYTGTSGSLGDVFWTRFENGNFTQPRGMGLGNMFENVGAPSVVAKQYQLSGQARNYMLLTGKLRGKSTAEGYMAQLSSNNSAVPSGRDPIVPFLRASDRIEFDAASGTFWAPGVRWRLNNSDLNNLDIRRVATNPASTILDLASREVDTETGIVSYLTTLGGRVVIDTSRGSIRFTGAVVPRNMSLFLVNYAPTLLRVSGTGGANYRNGSMIFDDRLLGIFVDGANPERNLVNDLNYWRTGINGNATINDPIRQDRFVMVFNRTSSDGGQAVRPFIKTMRYGVQLPTPVALNAQGQTVGALTVTFIGAQPEAPFYQIDPANGRVYFSQGVEDRFVNISYTGADASGNPIAAPINLTNVRVTLITERSEEAVPIEQVGNESDLTISREPVGLPWNAGNYRRPNLYWLIWTSTRAGTQDVFFQTIAPRFAPQPPTP